MRTNLVVLWEAVLRSTPLTGLFPCESFLGTMLSARLASAIGRSIEPWGPVDSEKINPIGVSVASDIDNLYRGTID